LHLLAPIWLWLIQTVELPESLRKQALVLLCENVACIDAFLLSGSSTLDHLIWSNDNNLFWMQFLVSHGGLPTMILGVVNPIQLLTGSS
jgi:hypothetical protein